MRLTSKQATLLVLATLIALAPLFFPSTFYYRIGALVFVNGLAVVGIVILTGYAGQISLGHAGFAGIGAYACALAPAHLGIHVGLAAILGAVISAILAYLVGRPILRLKGYYLGVATLGFGILVAMVLSNESQLTGGPDGMQVPDLGLRGLLGDMGLNLSNAQFWYAFSGLCLLIGAWLALNLHNSPTGRAWRALHGSEIAARTVGVDVARLKLQAFVISAVYASVSGSLLALQNRFITPEVAGYHAFDRDGDHGCPRRRRVGAGRDLWRQHPDRAAAGADRIRTNTSMLMLGLVMMLVMIFLREGLLPSLLRLFRGRGE